MSVAGRGSEDRAVLQLADDALETLVRLERHVLRVFVADVAQPAAAVGLGNGSAAKAAGSINARGHR